MISDGGEERQEVSVNCSFLVQKLAAFTNYTFYVRAYSSKSASDQSKRTKCQTGEGGESLVGFTMVWATSNISVSIYLQEFLYTKIYKTIILAVVLYGCETWYLTLRE